MGARTATRLKAKSVSAAENRKWKLQRHEEILAAAFEEFAAKGYAEARLDDMAERAGIAKGTIYLYFKNKEVLFRAVLRGLIHHVVRNLELFVRSFPGSAEDLIRNVLSGQYTNVVNNPKARAMLRLLIAESHKFPQLSDLCLSEVIAPGMAAMRILVEKGVASGEFRKTKIAEFPQALLGPVILAMVWGLILGERQQLDLDAYMEAHLELLLYGLRKGSPSPGNDSQCSLSAGDEQ